MPGSDFLKDVLCTCALALPPGIAVSWLLGERDAVTGLFVSLCAGLAACIGIWSLMAYGGVAVRPAVYAGITSLAVPLVLVTVGSVFRFRRPGGRARTGTNPVDLALLAIVLALAFYYVAHPLAGLEYPRGAGAGDPGLLAMFMKNGAGYPVVSPYLDASRLHLGLLPGTGLHAAIVGGICRSSIGAAMGALMCLAAALVCGLMYVLAREMHGHVLVALACAAAVLGADYSLVAETSRAGTMTGLLTAAVVMRLLYGGLEGKDGRIFLVAGLTAGFTAFMDLDIYFSILLSLAVYGLMPSCDRGGGARRGLAAAALVPAVLVALPVLSGLEPDFHRHGDSPLLQDIVRLDVGWLLAGIGLLIACLRGKGASLMTAAFLLGSLAALEYRQAFAAFLPGPMVRPDITESAGIPVSGLLPLVLAVLQVNALTALLWLSDGNKSGGWDSPVVAEGKLALPWFVLGCLLVSCISPVWGLSVMVLPLIRIAPSGGRSRMKARIFMLNLTRLAVSMAGSILARAVPVAGVAVVVLLLLVAVKTEGPSVLPRAGSGSDMKVIEWLRTNTRYDATLVMQPPDTAQWGWLIPGMAERRCVFQPRRGQGFAFVRNGLDLDRLSRAYYNLADNGAWELLKDSGITHVFVPAEQTQPNSGFDLNKLADSPLYDLEYSCETVEEDEAENSGKGHLATENFTGENLRLIRAYYDTKGVKIRNHGKILYGGRKCEVVDVRYSGQGTYEYWLAPIRVPLKGPVIIEMTYWSRQPIILVLNLEYGPESGIFGSKDMDSVVSSSKIFKVRGMPRIGKPSNQAIKRDAVQWKRIVYMDLYRDAVIMAKSHSWNNKSMIIESIGFNTIVHDNRVIVDRISVFSAK